MNFQNFTRAFIISAALLGIKASHAMDPEREKAPSAALSQPAKIDHALKEDLRKDIMAFHDGLSQYCVVGSVLKALESPGISSGTSAQIGFNQLDVRDFYDSSQKSGNLSVDCIIKLGFQSTVGGIENSLKRIFTFKRSQSYEEENRGATWTALKAAVLQNLMDTLKQPDSSSQKA